MVENEQPQDRFERLLSSHVNFLKRSCWLYDQGHDDEALRIATSLRVIFHDTKSSTSLLTHLRKTRDGLDWVVGTARSGEPEAWWKDFFTVNLDFSSPTPVTVSPRISVTGNFLRQSTADWWSGESVFQHDGHDFTRSDIALAVANKDGGAHVDATLQAFYEALSSGKYGIGITADFEYDGEAPFEQGVTQYAQNGHLAMMRLIAHEVLVTASYEQWPVDDRPIVPWTSYPVPRT